VIDKVFADTGVEPNPHVETDSVASLYALVGAGECATIVPHTWLHALPVISTAKVARLIQPDARAQMSVAINAAVPGSLAARAFLSAAKGVAYNELFDRRLMGSPFDG
jgi:DNA-binding transcriptional LysR family regulator